MPPCCFDALTTCCPAARYMSAMCLIYSVLFPFKAAI